jgi:hypothetical protein
MKHFFRTVVGVSAIVVGLVACQGDVAPESEQLLQYIPAETPYVMAFTKPLPDDLMDKFEPVVDKTLSGYQRILRYKVSELLVELSEEEGGADKAEQLQEFVDEFTSLIGMQALIVIPFSQSTVTDCFPYFALNCRIAKNLMRRSRGSR